MKKTHTLNRRVQACYDFREILSYNDRKYFPPKISEITKQENRHIEDWLKIAEKLVAIQQDNKNKREKKDSKTSDNFSTKHPPDQKQHTQLNSF